MTWAGFDGRAYTREQWAAHVAETPIFPAATKIVVHSTGVPTLAQALAMNEQNYIVNTQFYYEQKLRWAHGPHGFAMHDVIFGFSALGARGTHCSCLNGESLGFEASLNRNTDDFSQGPGRDTLDNQHWAIACCLVKMGLKPTPATIIPHSDCRTDGHFQCPVENWAAKYRDDELVAIEAMMNGIGGKLVANPALAAQAKPIYQPGAAPPVGSIAWTQGLLNKFGAAPALVVDGDNGPATKAAVARFQGAHGLFVDGIAGPKTIAALEAAA